MRSLRNIFEELLCFLRTHDTDIIVSGEIRLEGYEVNYFEIEVYNVVHSSRECRAGGVSLYFKNNLTLELHQFILLHGFGSKNDFKIVNIWNFHVI